MFITYTSVVLSFTVANGNNISNVFVKKTSTSTYVCNFSPPVCPTLTTELYVDISKDVNQMVESESNNYSFIENTM